MPEILPSIQQKGKIILQYRGSNLALRHERASAIASCELKAYRFRLLEQMQPEPLTLQFRVDDFNKDVVLLFQSNDIHWQGNSNAWPKDEAGQIVENEIFIDETRVFFIGSFRATKFMETNHLEKYLEDYKYTAIFEREGLYQALNGLPFLRIKDIP